MKKRKANNKEEGGEYWEGPDEKVNEKKEEKKEKEDKEKKEVTGKKEANEEDGKTIIIDPTLCQSKYNQHNLIFIHCIEIILTR